MTRETVLAKVNELLAEILDRDDLAVTDSTTATDIAGWDSLHHLRLMMALEAEFAIKLDIEELDAPENFGRLVDRVCSKMSESGLASR